MPQKYSSYILIPFRLSSRNQLNQPLQTKDADACFEGGPSLCIIIAIFCKYPIRDL